MNNAPDTASSLTQRVAPLVAGAHVIAAGFLGADPVLALGDGHVMLGDVRLREGGSAIITAVAGPDRMLLGTDDGRVEEVTRAGEIRILGDEKGRWIDGLAPGPDGAVAWACGKKVVARDGKGALRELATESTSRGLSFRPKGYMLAVAQNGGALLWMPNAVAKPDQLSWKGSHLDITWSPDARFVVTSMQENALHGWRVADKAHMRMTGYPAKTRSFDWSHDGNWLASSGADACIVWPFASKDGPMGKAPRECGVRSLRVNAVAFHPASLVVAMGYDDGCILMCRLTDASELLVRAPLAPGSRDSVTALRWDHAGKRLVFGTAEGAAGVLTLP